MTDGNLARVWAAVEELAQLWPESTEIVVCVEDRPGEWRVAVDGGRPLLRLAGPWRPLTDHGRDTVAAELEALVFQEAENRANLAAAMMGGPLGPPLEPWVVADAVDGRR